MNGQAQTSSAIEIGRLHRDFVKRKWLVADPDCHLARTREDFLELAQMLQSARLLAAYVFGSSKQERNIIFFNSRFGRMLSDLCDELHNLARPVKSERLLPVDDPKPRNTNHPEKDAVTLITLNSCAALMPYHKSKRACFREVSELLRKHDTFLKPETIAKIWYAKVKTIRTEGPPTGPNSYADVFIAWGAHGSSNHGRATHSDTISNLSIIMGQVLPAIDADLRNAAKFVRSPPV